MSLNPKLPCPHCDKPIVSNALRRHAEACARRPTNDELRNMRAENLAVDSIAKEIGGVSHSTVATWLKEAGINGSIKRTKRYPTQVYPETALAYGRRGSCKSCGYLAVCRDLEAKGERVLCEAQDRADRANEGSRNGGPSTPPPSYDRVWDELCSLVALGPNSGIKDGL